MKISKNVLDTYTELCKFSSAKCESYHDIEYKIRRHIELGKAIEYKNGGDTIIVRYFDLDFTIHNNVVTEMIRDKSKPEVYVSERTKRNYDKIHSKMIV